jgi:hypothetical protein
LEWEENREIERKNRRRLGRRVDKVGKKEVG